MELVRNGIMLNVFIINNHFSFIFSFTSNCKIISLINELNSKNQNSYKTSKLITITKSKSKGYGIFGFLQKIRLNQQQPTKN